MLVSIICASDRVDRLPCLYWSLRAQTHTDWELLVLDQSICNVAVYVPRDERVRHFQTASYSDWGQTVKDRAARGSADGAAFMFPADDSYYVPGALQQMVATLEAGHDLVVCGWVYNTVGYQALPPSIDQGFVDIGGFMVRKEAFLKADWYDKSQIGDFKLLQSIIDKGARVAFHPSILYVKN